jgi:hypothetical protein
VAAAADPAASTGWGKDASWPSLVGDGAGESASRLLIVLVIMTMQFGRIDAFNEMCAGFKVK